MWTNQYRCRIHSCEMFRRNSSECALVLGARTTLAFNVHSLREQIPSISSSNDSWHSDVHCQRKRPPNKHIHCSFSFGTNYIFPPNLRPTMLGILTCTAKESGLQANSSCCFNSVAPNFRFLGEKGLRNGQCSPNMPTNMPIYFDFAPVTGYDALRMTP